MRFARGSVIDRIVRHVMSSRGWPGAVLMLGGLLAFLLVPSTQWPDYRDVPDDVEQATTLGVAALGLLWTLAAAAFPCWKRGGRASGGRDRSAR